MSETKKRTGRFGKNGDIQYTCNLSRNKLIQQAEVLYNGNGNPVGLTPWANDGIVFSKKAAPGTKTFINGKFVRDN